MLQYFPTGAALKKYKKNVGKTSKNYNEPDQLTVVKITEKNISLKLENDIKSGQSWYI